MKRFGFAQFGQEVLGKSFYHKQTELLNAADKNGCYVVGRFNNGGGKTREVLTTIILGSLVLHKAKVLSTSGSFRQIKNQLTPALQAYASRFLQYDFQQNRVVTADPNCFWDGFSTNESGKFEGQHGDPAHPLVLIVDEAKTVKDPIFGAVDRCRPPRQHCRVIVVSSAGYAGGEFYRLNTTRRDALTHPPVKQTSKECPHITAEEIEADRKKWGPDHPLVRSMHDAEFMGFVQGAIVQVAALDELLSNPPPERRGARKAFCDFAWSESASGDENVLALRDGNVVTIEAAFREKGIHAVAGRFVQHFNRLGLKPWEIEGDGDGEGANIIKILRNMGWAIGTAHNGGAPRFNEHYGNLASEMWGDGSQAIINREVILPDDPDLYGQMLDRKWVTNNKGRLTAESKQAMKDPNREGGAVQNSPDKADAVFGAIAPLPMSQSQQVMGQAQPLAHNKDTFWGSRDAEPEEDHGQVLPGTHFG